ncbi:MAG: GGDEF domain-containing protein [Thiotrichales bacterium]|nr:GGDEF domain-containing protein [Thiotrichales bacterium]
MHKLLARQLKKSFGKNCDFNTFSDELDGLFESISDAYEDYDHDRKILELTLEKNSYELTTANRLISDQNDSLIHQLKTLSRSRAFLTRLIDSVHMFIVTSNANLEVITVNKKFSGSLNKTYHHFLDIFPENDLTEKFRGELQSLLSNKLEVIHNDMELKDSLNNVLYISWSHTLVEDEQGNPIILSIGSDLTKRKEAEDALHWLAHHDPLTLIGNRRSFQYSLQHMLSSNSQGALVFIDVNHFKQINDFYGHSVGDLVLINIANALKKVTRSNDVISRLSGDEFTVILCRVNSEVISLVLDKLVTALNSHIILEDGSKLEYSVSIGVSLFPEHAHQQEQLIINADLAMYKAKKKGLGRWHLFSPETDDFSSLQTDNLQMRSIKNALEENRYQLNYQPILKLQDKTISHYEALIRQIDENGNLVYPGSFIPAAERMGLIQDIDEWVLEHVLKCLARELPSRPELVITVNISAPTLQEGDLPRLLVKLLEKYQVPCNHLIIELTETAYIDNFEEVLRNLTEIDALGVRIALDDFGVGFSSFSYLKRMPLSYVKLDGSYVKTLLQSHEDQVFVESLSNMVQAFGMKTIAEFVGDQATCNRLLELGVTYGQGYFIGKPQPYLATIDEVRKNIGMCEQ